MSKSFYGSILNDLKKARILSIIFLLIASIIGVLFGRMMRVHDDLKYELQQKENDLAFLRDCIETLSTENERLKELLPIKAYDLDSLIEGVALSFNLPPGFVKAIALIESNNKPTAINMTNNNGTFDYGLMQLNSSWFAMDLWHDAYTNLIAACLHITTLRKHCDTWYQIALAYNCGLYGSKHPTQVGLAYADRVIDTWKRLDD